MTFRCPCAADLHFISEFEIDALISKNRPSMSARCVQGSKLSGFSCWEQRTLSIGRMTSGCRPEGGFGPCTLRHLPSIGTSRSTWS